MRVNSFLTAVATAATLFLVSCKDSGTSGLNIPKDAAMVVHINTSSLTSKLSWDEIKNSSWFKQVSEDTRDSLAKKLFENPENSGIDLKSDFVFFMKKQGRGGYQVFEGKLKDAKAFEAMVKEKNKDEQVQKDGDLKYIKTGSGELLSWTDSKFIAISSSSAFNQSGMYDSDGGSRSFSSDSLKQFTKDLLALKSSNSLNKNSRFGDLLKENGEVHVFMNYEQYMSAMAGGMMSMLKVGDLLKDMAVTYTLNFDQGKISLNGKFYTNDKVGKLYEKYKTREVDAALLNRIPSNDVVGVMAFNFDPAIIVEGLKLSGMDGMANGMLSDFNLSVEELVNASKGQFLFSLSDLQMKKKKVTIPGYGGSAPYTYNTTDRDFNALFATSVNNKSTFDKLLGIAKEKMMKTDTTINYNVTNDWFAVSNKKATVDQFLAGTNNKMPFADKITGHPFGMYVDLQKVIKAFGSDLDDASDSASFDASMKMWQDVVATGGEFKNNVSTFNFDINLVDKSKNSLKQISEYANKMAAARKLKKQEAWTESMDSDSTTVAAPAQVEPAGH
jgi:hypothetical protein